MPTHLDVQTGIAQTVAQHLTTVSPLMADLAVNALIANGTRHDRPQPARAQEAAKLGENIVRDVLEDV